MANEFIIKHGLLLGGDATFSGSLETTHAITASAFSGNGSGLTGVAASDPTKLPLTGGTLTGNLNINADTTLDGTLKLGSGFMLTTALQQASLPSGMALSIGGGRMYIDGSGLIGIGTPFPNGDLDVNGTTVTSQLAVNTTSVSARLNVKGSGTTSATTALLIENSAGTDLLKIYDDGQAVFNNSIGANSLQASIIRLNYINTANNLYSVALTNGTDGSINFLNNVGIGVTSPSEKLEVNGNIKFTSNGSQLRNSAGNNMLNDTSNLITIGNGATSTVYARGNVGIGTASPVSRLQVNVGTDQNVAINSHSSVARISSYNDAASASTPLKINSSDLRFDINNSERMRIDSSGNVGIGTTSPSSKLTIGANGVTTLNPTAIISDTTNGGSLVLRGLSPILAFDKTSTGVPKILMDSGGLQFKTGTLDAEGDIDMVILPDGNVGIGTSSPSTLLHIEGSSTGYLQTIKNTTAGGDYLQMLAETGDAVFQFESGGTGGEATLNMYRDGTQYVKISADAGVDNYFNNGANVGIGTTSPDALLHVRAATNVTGTIEVQGGKTTVTSVGEINSELNFGSNDASATGGIGGSIKSVTESSNGAYVGMSFYTAKQGRAPVLEEAMRIDQSGKVGIGTTSPNQKLQVSGVSGAAISILTPWAAGAYGQLRFDTGTGNSSIRSSVPGNSTNGLDFYTYSSSSETVKMSILGSGNVGIGTASPISKLHVVGTSTSGLIRLTATSGVARIASSNTAGSAWEDLELKASDILLSPQGGNVGIGQTSPTARLNVKGSGATSATDALLVENSSGTDLLQIRDDGHAIFNAGVETNNIKASVAKISYINTFNNSYSVALTDGTDGSINFLNNVGIGVTNPSEKLEVAGNIKASDGTSYASIIPSTQVGSLSTKSQSIHGAIVTAVSNGLTFASQNVYSGTNIGSFNAAGTVAIGAFNYGNVNYQTGHSSFVHSWYGSRAGAPWLTLNGTGLGIGTTAPSAKLNVKGSGTTSATAALLVENSSGTDLLKIEDGGNVGIGMAPTSNRKLAIGGTILVDASNGANGIKFLRPSDSATMEVLSAPNSGTLKIGGGNQSSVKIFAHTTEVARFTSNGDVGIGTLAPLSTLSIKDATPGSPAVITLANSANSVGSSLGRLDFYGLTAGQGLGASIEGTRGNNYVSGNLLFNTGEGAGNVTERMRITSTGNVGIGTTTPSEKLTVEGNISGSGDVNIVGDVIASAFSGDGSALTGIPTTSPAGNNNNIQYNNSGAFGGSNNFVYTSAGRLGIGVSAPSTAVEIKNTVAPVLTITNGGGAGASTAPTIHLKRLDTVGSKITYGPADKNFVLQNDFDQSSTIYGRIDFNTRGANTRMRILADGNVGIGVTATAKLHVKGSGTTSATTALLVEDSAGTDLLQVRDDGKVGIGIAPNSTAKLIVEGSFIAGGSTTSGLFYNRAVDTLAISNQIMLAKSGANVYIGKSSTNLIFRNNNLETARFTSNGNFGIGTTTPSAKLTVRGTGTTSATAALSIEDNNGTPRLIVGDNGDTILNGPLKLGSGFMMTTALEQASLPSGMALSIGGGRMYIDFYGQIGIGTPFPNGALDVNGLTITSQLGVNNTGGGVAPQTPSTPPDTMIGNGNPSEFLGAPDVWLIINVNGTDFQFPGYA